MASADLQKELECSICLNILTDPRMLKCGHNFCQKCINCVLDTQKSSGRYFCPQCREEFLERPTLHRNITLRNLLENLMSTQPGQEISGKACAYCIHFLVPAVKYCLHCEAPLCDNHLRVHNQSPEHVLCDPNTSLENKKCPVHKELLKYYCTQDDVCICVSCSLAGEHRGHLVETLEVAFEMKKKTLRDYLKTMTTKREETEKRVQNLKESVRKVQEKEAREKDRVTDLFRDLRRQLKDFEVKVLSEMSRKTEQISSPLSDLIRKLEIKKDELSRKIRHIEELCDKTDPMTVFKESHMGDLCSPEDEEQHDSLLYVGGDLNVAGMSHMFKTISDIIERTDVSFSIQKAADITLDINTAHNKLQILDDRKTVSCSNVSQNYPETPQRFQKFFHVLSRQNFVSGQNFWEVDVGGSDSWRVGICYPSMDRNGDSSMIGRNNKSWGFYKYKNKYSVVHNNKEIQLPDNISSDRVRVCLDYEGGTISFYSLCDTVRHLHTYNATFTEPLHAALGVWNGCVKICGGGSSSLTSLVSGDG